MSLAERVCRISLENCIRVSERNAYVFFACAQIPQQSKSSKSMVDFILNDEQQEYQKLAREVAQRHLAPNGHKHDVAPGNSNELLSQILESGLAHVQLPAELGGLGLGCWDLAVITEELAAGCSGLSSPVEFAALALLPLLRAKLSTELNGMLKALPEQASMPGLALDMFSAASSSLSYERKGDQFVLNGTVSLLANASNSEWFVLPAISRVGMSLFVVPANTPGVEIGDKTYMLGRRAASVHSAVLKNATISASHLVGTEGGAQELIDAARPAAFVILSAACVGIARSAMEHAVRYSKERHTMGKPIGEHQGVAFMLADMAKDVEASRLLTWQAAATIDAGHDAFTAASAARSFSQNAAIKVATDAVQVFGGYGYSKEYPVEKLMRDAKMYQLFDGTSAELNLKLGRQLIAGASK